MVRVIGARWLCLCRRVSSRLAAESEKLGREQPRRLQAAIRGQDRVRLACAEQDTVVLVHPDRGAGGLPT